MGFLKNRVSISGVQKYIADMGPVEKIREHPPGARGFVHQGQKEKCFTLNSTMAAQVMKKAV